jgi:hypothetical protein
MSGDQQVLQTEERMAKRQVDGQELVSASRMAAHFGVERSYLDTLVNQGVIERRPDGLYDQSASRLRYFTHLRTERKRSPKSEADIEFQRAKTALIQMRLEEKRKELVPLATFDDLIDDVAGDLLTELSALPVRIGGSDLPLRRKVEQAVTELRRRLAETALRRASEAEMAFAEQGALAG